MSRRVVAGLSFGFLALLVGAGYLWFAFFRDPYPVEVSFCPAGAESADLDVYHYFGDGGAADHARFAGQDCEPLMTYVAERSVDDAGLAGVEVTVVVARAEGREKTSEVRRLAGAAGFAIRQDDASGWRADRTWPLLYADDAMDIDRAEVPQLS